MSVRYTKSDKALLNVDLTAQWSNYSTSHVFSCYVQGTLKQACKMYYFLTVSNKPSLAGIIIGSLN